MNLRARRDIISYYFLLIQGATATQLDLSFCTPCTYLVIYCQVRNHIKAIKITLLFSPIVLGVDWAQLGSVCLGLRDFSCCCSRWVLGLELPCDSATHMSGRWCWLLAGTSMGALARQLYLASVWSCHFLIARWLSFRTSVPGEPSEIHVVFHALTLEVPQHQFWCCQVQGEKNKPIPL